MSWRRALSIDVLRDEVDEKWSDRSKISDGTIGDTAHAANWEGSDHNPWVIDDDGEGVVRARDITANVDDPDPDNVDGEWLFQHIIALGRAGFEPLQNHGYVIYNGRAAYATNGWKVVAYHGKSPHKEHVHVSVGRGAEQYDSTLSWQIADLPDLEEFTVDAEAKARFDAIDKRMDQIANAVLVDIAGDADDAKQSPLAEVLRRVKDMHAGNWLKGDLTWLDKRLKNKGADVHGGA